jgi:hypothetical protein
LRRGMGGKRKANSKSHLWLSESMASGASAAAQEKKRLVCANWRDAKMSIWGGPLREDIWKNTMGERCQSKINWNLDAAVHLKILLWRDKRRQETKLTLVGKKEDPLSPLYRRALPLRSPSFLMWARAAVLSILHKIKVWCVDGGIKHKTVISLGDDASQCEFEPFLKSTASHQDATYFTLICVPSVDAVDAVPIPAVEMALKPDAESPIGGVRLDLYAAVLGRQRPQVTVAIADLELRDP